MDTTFLKDVYAVYSIKNTVNGRRYYGQTFDYEKRMHQHFNDLKNGKHQNKELQKDFNKYGMKGFYLDSLDFAFDKETALKTEQEMIEIDKDCYNFVGNEKYADLIAERTHAGLESARARGRKGGRPKTDQKVLDKAIRLYETKEYTVKQITEMTGVSKPKLYQELNKRKAVQ